MPSGKSHGSASLAVHVVGAARPREGHIQDRGLAATLAARRSPLTPLETKTALPAVIQTARYLPDTASPSPFATAAPTAVLSGNAVEARSTTALPMTGDTIYQKTHGLSMHASAKTACFPQASHTLPLHTPRASISMTTLPPSVEGAQRTQVILVSATLTVLRKPTPLPATQT